MPQLKKLTEDKNALITRAEEIVKTAEDEKRDLSTAELAEINQLREKAEGLKRQIEAVKAVSGMTREEAPEEKEEDKKEDDKSEDEKAKEEAETRSFEANVRAMLGVADFNTRNDLTPLSKGNNGSIVPVTIARRIIRRLYDISPILERSTKYDLPGTLTIPYYAEDATNFINVGFQGPEFTEIGANSGKFTSITLNDYVVGALALISRQLINNTEFDLVGYIVDQIVYSVRRFMEKTLIQGSGAITGQTGTVEGLTGITQAVNAAAANAITADELIDVQDSVKDMFQDNAMWVMSPKTRTAIRKLKSNTGYYLLQDDINAPFGKSLLGKPVYVSDNMPEIGSGASPIIYGNFAGLATKFSKNLEIDVLREKYATSYAYGINAWLSFDSKVENAQMLSKLTMASASA